MTPSQPPQQIYRAPNRPSLNPSPPIAPMPYTPIPSHQPPYVSPYHPIHFTELTLFKNLIETSRSISRVKSFTHTLNPSAINSFINLDDLLEQNISEICNPLFRGKIRSWRKFRICFCGRDLEDVGFLRAILVWETRVEIRGGDARGVVRGVQSWWRERRLVRERRGMGMGMDSRRGGGMQLRGGLSPLAYQLLQQQLLQAQVQRRQEEERMRGQGVRLVPITPQLQHQQSASPPEKEEDSKSTLSDSFNENSTLTNDYPLTFSSLTEESPTITSYSPFALNRWLESSTPCIPPAKFLSISPTASLQTPVPFPDGSTIERIAAPSPAVIGLPLPAAPAAPRMAYRQLHGIDENITNNSSRGTGEARLLELRRMGVSDWRPDGPLRMSLEGFIIS